MMSIHKVINDGARNLVMKFTNLSDGTGESLVTKVDVSALSTQPRTGASLYKYYCF